MYRWLQLHSSDRYFFSLPQARRRSYAGRVWFLVPVERCSILLVNDVDIAGETASVLDARALAEGQMLRRGDRCAVKV